jgi:sugar phosphate permease
MFLWAAIWALAGVAGAMMLAIVVLLSWWSYEAGTVWITLLFVGLLVTLVSLSPRRKREDADAENGASSNGRPAV